MFCPIGLYISVLSTCVFVLSNEQSGSLVETTLGNIRGSFMKTEKGLDISAFRGIRYAQAPIGAKRFQAPLSVTKWEGELNAIKDGSVCPQTIILGETQQSEDCLFLNVYSTDLRGNNSVVVYIHGGSNSHGNSHSLSGFGPGYILDTNVVLVTFNYRLGPFGFLSLGSKEASGNYGYLDQVMVLKWVHDHISRFGGNPNSVTLLGVSAGGMAVTLHMASPLSKGLFHKAIAMSGSATNDIVFDNVKWSRKLARQTSCPMFNPDDVLSCLRKLPWETVIKVCNSWDVYGFPNIKWGYQVDGYFMEAPLTDLFAQGNFTKMPILTGLTKNEFTFSVYSQENNTGLLNDISLNFEKYATELFMHDLENPKKVKKLQDFYLGKKSINDQNVTHFGEIFSDSFIGHGVHRLVDLARNYVDVFYYRFDYDGRFGIYIDSEGNSRGVSHGDDMLYFMKVDFSDAKFTTKDPEWFMVENMIGMISSFAKNGSPQDIDNVKWLPVNKTDWNTMYIDKESALKYAPFTERFRLWDELFPVSSSSKFYFGSLLNILMGVIVPFIVKYLF